MAEPDLGGRRRPARPRHHHGHPADRSDRAARSAPAIGGGHAVGRSSRAGRVGADRHSGAAEPRLRLLARPFSEVAGHDFAQAGDAGETGAGNRRMARQRRLRPLAAAQRPRHQLGAAALWAGEHPSHVSQDARRAAFDLGHLGRGAPPLPRGRRQLPRQLRRNLTDARALSGTRAHGPRRRRARPLGRLLLCLPRLRRERARHRRRAEPGRCGVRPGLARSLRGRTRAATHPGADRGHAARARRHHPPVFKESA